jgi:acyl dehydratase
MVLSAAELNIGDSRTLELFDDLKRTQIVMYAGASGDYNPLHSDEVFTTQVAGYRSVFAHGMLTMGATGRVLTDWIGDEQLTDYGVRFVGQVWPGDTLTATATVAALREEDGQHYVDLTVSTVNQEGAPVVTGTATARIDP